MHGTCNVLPFDAVMKNLKLLTHAHTWQIDHDDTHCKHYGIEKHSTETLIYGRETTIPFWCTDCHRDTSDRGSGIPEERKEEHTMTVMWLVLKHNVNKLKGMSRQRWHFTNSHHEGTTVHEKYSTSKVLIHFCEQQWCVKDKLRQNSWDNLKGS